MKLPIKPALQRQPGRQQVRCLHIVDPDSEPPVESSPQVLCKTGHQVAQQRSREPLGDRMSGTRALHGPIGHLEQISCNHKLRVKEPQSRGSVGICAPTVMAKKFCQRLADQASFL
jgi:hypothetical protein